MPQVKSVATVPPLPQQRHQDQRQGREDHPVDRLPARVVQDRPREERHGRRGGEDEEVVHALRLAPLGRSVAVGDHRRRSDEAEVPADPHDSERPPEIDQLKPRQRDHGRDSDEQHPCRRHTLLAEARHETSSNETRREHRQKMPLDSQRGAVDRMAGVDHRDR